MNRSDASESRRFSRNGSIYTPIFIIAIGLGQASCAELRAMGGGAGANEKQGGREGQTEDKPRPSKYTSMTDDEIARISIKDLFGELQQVTRVAPPEKPGHHGQAEATLIFVDSIDYLAFWDRQIAILEKRYKEPDKHVSDTLYTKACLERLRFNGITDPEGVKMCVSNGLWRFQFFDLEPAIASIVHLDGYLNVIADKTFVAQTRERFVKTLGYERTKYKATVPPAPYKNREEYYGVVVKERPLSAWSYRTVRYALDYAKSRSLDAALVKSLEEALVKAPRYRCKKVSADFVRDYEGGGNYGAPYFAPDREDGDVVPCDEAAKVKPDEQMMKLLPAPKPLDDVHRWLAVDVKGDGKVVYDSGSIRGKRQPIVVYWEQEY